MTDSRGEETIVIPCPTCKGTGMVWKYIPSFTNPTNGDYDLCGRCDRTGKLEVTRSYARKLQAPEIRD